MPELIFPALFNLIRAKKSSSSPSGTFLLRYISHGFFQHFGFPVDIVLARAFVPASLLVSLLVSFPRQQPLSTAAVRSSKRVEDISIKKSMMPSFGKFTKMAMLRQQQC